ncbi:hypothetical protein GE09DRAFT_1142072 [Coniochaeta sp. 2T2.1]|nr:hypothetical protein GE09DRAFT_1142072 [Coniochaeta sp. 2T2.1]
MGLGQITVVLLPALPFMAAGEVYYDCLHIPAPEEAEMSTSRERQTIPGASQVNQSKSQQEVEFRHQQDVRPTHTPLEETT